MAFIWISNGQSHVGSVRKINEDSMLERASIGIWAVADGMGGHQAGDFASQTVVSALNHMPRRHSLNDYIDEICRQMRQSNDRLRQFSHAQCNQQVVGTTVVILIFHDNEYACLWAGDSRCYLLRDQQLIRVSKDHSHVEDLITAGEISREDAETHPLANVITRAVGAHDQLELEVRRGPLQRGDTFLLCSDGLTKELSETEIEYLLGNGTVKETNKALIRESLLRQADDNVTSVLIKVDEVNVEAGNTVPHLYA